MEVKNYILFTGRCWKIYVCLSIWPECCAICVRVMFNNQYNNFLAYTSQIWPDKKRDIPNPMSLSREECILEILAHLRYPIEKLPLSSQDSESKSINISFYLFRKK